MRGDGIDEFPDGEDAMAADEALRLHGEGAARQSG